MTFGEKLRGLRQDRDMTQAQLGVALKTTQRKISYLEMGKTEPNIEDLKRICGFFKVSADYLLELPYHYNQPN